MVPHDPEAVKSWIYSTNYSVRMYQKAIVEAALYENTMVRTRVYEAKIHYTIQCSEICTLRNTFFPTEI